MKLIPSLGEGNCYFSKIKKGDFSIYKAFVLIIALYIPQDTMEKILRKLSVLIIREMQKKNQSCLQFAELCGIDRNVMGNIVNQKKNDVKLSTIYKICENSAIRIENIFCDCKTEQMLNNAILIINGKRYILELKEYK